MPKLSLPSRLLLRLTFSHLAVAVILLLGIGNVVLWRDPDFWGPPPGVVKTLHVRKHPIERLMLEAKRHHDTILDKQSTTLDDAAAKYRTRRGRHPPPGFDAWFQGAKDANATIVEDYFDRIYKDLRPYWALDADTLKKRSSAWHWVVKVRNGNATAHGNVDGFVNWLQLWTELVAEFAEHLPDVDMPINYMDESRLLVPYETLDKLVEEEAKARIMPEVEDVIVEYSGFQNISEADLRPYDPNWWGAHDDQYTYWDLAVKTCGPDTPAHGIKQVDSFANGAQFPTNYAPKYTYKGFVQNWTTAIDPCQQPHLRQLHGTFIKPISLSSSEELIPLFGGSKLPMNNEILIPGAMYLTDRDFYSGGNNPGPRWEKKKTMAVWRGVDSGGHINENTWPHLQRHRLVDMMNATSVSLAETTTGGRTLTFELPNRELYPRTQVKDGEFGSWIKKIANVGFGSMCEHEPCAFLASYYRTVGGLTMLQQYQYKFLPDVDGNSFSARFRGFLRSTSLPLKATIYTEWHDDRLVPWLHFVPLDNTLQDLYAVLDFFADEDGPGDFAAKFIADRGKNWAETALRREDMRLYVWRLLLEWARICDEKRALLGFVDDLKKSNP